MPEGFNLDADPTVYCDDMYMFDLHDDHSDGSASVAVHEVNTASFKVSSICIASINAIHVSICLHFLYPAQETQSNLHGASVSLAGLGGLINSETVRILSIRQL